MPFLDKLKKAFIPPDVKSQYAPPPDANRSQVWMDITIGDRPVGRIEMELFDKVLPKTSANFRELCRGHEQNGKVMGYKGSIFHRVVQDFMIQGGDIIRNNGTGMYSIYGGPFPDEDFKFGHDVPGLLSMANSGPNTNGCQFFITVAPAEYLNGKHVVFGRVTKGMDVVRAVEGVEAQDDRPLKVVRVAACGVFEQATDKDSSTSSTIATDVQAPGTAEPEQFHDAVQQTDAVPIQGQGQGQGQGHGLKALYRRFSRSQDNDHKEHDKEARTTPALAGAVHDFAGTSPVDHRREVDGKLTTSPPTTGT
ncbi:hypothetical protein CspHIS471_0309560 [Cutaneotrichosporon sp. HIS471]|nr:hypothetical protein CspHIS471_0309560 [Cutaneotrichosporon sp. HIS471]